MQQETIQMKDEDATGRDLPTSDGTVSDEDAAAITDKGQGKTGQDRSTEGHERTEPTGGVGGVQDSSDTTSDVARIRD